MRRIKGIALGVALALGGLLPAGAQATTLVMTGDSTTNRGYIGLQIYATADLTRIEVGEIVDGEYRYVKDIAMQPVGNLPPYGPFQVGVDQQVATWDCGRRNRDFVATGHLADGTTQTARFAFRTPSCESRLQVRLPERVRPGRTVTAIVRDTFAVGGVDARFCARGPGRRASCRILSLPPGVDRVSTRFRAPRKGRYHVNLASGPQRLKRVVSAGQAPRPQDLAHLPTLLTTGDSMMQTVDQVLGDGLDGRATLASDPKIASGFTKPEIVDWAKLPARQVRRTEPDATVIYLGANEGDPLTPPGGGAEVGCCGPQWRAGYRQFARRTMQTYIGADGEGAVVWLLNPVPGDPKRVESMAAVNLAVRQAAKGLRRARLVDLGALFSPGGQYQDEVGGVRVRQDDKIHLSLAGARLTVKPIVAALDELGALDQD